MILRQIALALAFIMPASAQAVTINYGPLTTSSNGEFVSFSDLPTPTTITGDAIVLLTANGDLENRNETFSVLLDGFSLGVLFNSNTGDDLFDFAGDAVGNGVTATGSATISQATMASLISDGLLNLTFSLSNQVKKETTLSGQISFVEAPAAVPLPSSLALFGAGLVGFSAVRQRKMKPRPVA